MWIEIKGINHFTEFSSSRPARALWIEIVMAHGAFHELLVEAREGLVD